MTGTAYVLIKEPEPVSDATGVDLEQFLDDAVALHEAGDYAGAERAYRRVLHTEPDHPDALNFLGVLLQDTNRYAESQQVLEQAVGQVPDFAEALCNLARVLQVTGQAGAAAESARRALAADADLQPAHLLLGRALLDQGDLAAAEAPLRAAIALQPADAEAHLHLGASLMGLGRIDEARQAYQTAMLLDGERIGTMLKIAGSWLTGAHADDAVRVYERAAAIDPQSADAIGGLALAYHLQQRPRQCEEACRRALALVPDKTDIRLLLGHSLACLGRFNEAAAELREALARDPSSVKARQDLAVLGRVTAGDRDAAVLSAVLRNEVAPARDRVAAAFGVGLVLDRAGEYDEAFSAYTVGNRLVSETRKAAGRGFQAERLLHSVARTKSVFQPALFAGLAGYGHPSDDLVFIVGMPRSGTSLVDQVVASHPAVFGAGERNLIGGAINRLNDGGETGSPAEWRQADASAEAEQCLAEYRALDGSGAATRIVDKLPYNIFLLGYIAVLFPHARVIFCNRDMRDICLSAYFQHFASETAWSYDLADCAEQAQQTARLAAHWRQTLPLRMIDVDYEAIVSDIEGQSRRLIDFLGLEWDPSCLSFQATPREVMTASAWQVRQPIYATAIGRWKYYRRHLTALIFGLLGLIPEPDAEDWNLLLADPDHALEIGLVHHRRGRLTAAKQIYDAVLARAPDSPRLHHLLGVLWLNQRQAGNAMPWLLRAAAQRPNDAKVRTDLARAYNAIGDKAAAAASARIAVESDPSCVEALCQFGYALLDTDPDGALDAMERAAALAPDSCFSLVGMATVLCRQKRFADSERLWRQADRLYPGEQDVLSGLAYVMFEQGRHQASLLASQQALACNPGSAELLQQAGGAYLRNRQVEDAIELLKQSLTIDETLADSWRLLAYARAMSGDHDAAATHYRKALSLKPFDGKSLSGLVKIANAEATGDVLEAMEAVRKSPASSAADKSAVAFALAETCDKRGDHAAAFALFAEANAASRTNRGAYDPEQAKVARVELVDWLIAHFTSNVAAASALLGFDSDVPAFIVGSPRSGTTLVDQIAASHPAVCSLGEAGEFLELLGSEAKAMLNQPPEQWDALRLRPATEAFVARLRQEGGDAERIVNKSPGNLIWLAHIAILLPRARIIVCRRDLRDVAWSCYTQEFSENVLAWTETLEECAAYTREMERLLDHWCSTLPGRFLEVYYEDVVEDLEREARRVIDYLGLPWDPACLSFHETRRVVMTASHWQVRQPLYATSVGRWRPYRHHLGPLLDGLKGLVPEDD
jgi:tetratricopeptide (TPR) repeat protein